MEHQNIRSALRRRGAPTKYRPASYD